ncbi:hypothetical protein ACFQWB_14020 [Paenibacillus thermoaerophilus]|uniref:Uncharacterized protein n=1 Tax=Paenibacillus thermoaerophilus TaxID=1215385 RepID=A0ABW2V708_9BACL|nr:hypothetical protein [Paenibacillus thermoaerophilus]TMV15933.1 hypothetical protein FE781_10130 [Paenibacillus thermoaerophilus]
MKRSEGHAASLNENSFQAVAARSVPAMLNALASLLSSYGDSLLYFSAGTGEDSGTGAPARPTTPGEALEWADSAESRLDMFRHGLWLESERIRLYARLAGSGFLCEAGSREEVASALSRLRSALARAAEAVILACCRLLESVNEAGDRKHAFRTRGRRLLEALEHLFVAARRIAGDCEEDEDAAFPAGRGEPHFDAGGLDRLERAIVRAYMDHPPARKSMRETAARIRLHLRRGAPGHEERETDAGTKPWTPFAGKEKSGGRPGG